LAEEVPFYYTNVVETLTSPYDIVSIFGIKNKKNQQDYDPVVKIAMSLQQAKVYAILLVEQIEKYETNIGKIPILEEYQNRIKGESNQ